MSQHYSHWAYWWMLDYYPAASSRAGASYHYPGQNWVGCAAAGSLHSISGATHRDNAPTWRWVTDSNAGHPWRWSGHSDLGKDESTAGGAGRGSF